VAAVPRISHASGVAKWQRFTTAGAQARSAAASSPMPRDSLAPAMPVRKTAKAPATAESTRPASVGSAPRPESRPASAARCWAQTTGSMTYTGSVGLMNESGASVPSRAMRAA
jgi:hypothetical protein